MSRFGRPADRWPYRVIAYKGRNWDQEPFHLWVGSLIWDELFDSEAEMLKNRDEAYALGEAGALVRVTVIYPNEKVVRTFEQGRRDAA